ncbi:MAG: fibronectin type III domain-containing protein [Chitinivibrionia bacterium]|nr:fibronectin type III domain-containing protein [Chitinivibrionia bacterium]
MKKNMFFAATFAIIAFLLSCSLDPYGEGLGANSTGGDSSIITTNPGVEINNGGGETNCTKLLSAPYSVSATALSESSIRISWSSVSGADYYNVYYSTTANGTYNYLKNVRSPSITHTDAGLSPSTPRYYKVSAGNNCGESALSSDYDFAKTTCTISATPGGILATGIAQDTIRVTWNPVQNATGYYVYYGSTSSANTSSYKVTGTSFKLYGLSAGSTRYFKVSSYNDCGESAQSNTVSATTCTNPSAPSRILASGQSSSSIRISWNQVSGATSYNVYRSTTSSTSGFTKVGTVSSTSTSYTDTGLSSNQTYYYRVSAVNNCGESALSSDYDLASTICTTINAPANVSAQALSSRSIKISWNPVDGATSYNVYYCTTANGTYQKRGSTSSSTTSYTDDYGLSPATPYFYKVTAVSSCGESALGANIAAATTGN